MAGRTTAIDEAAPAAPGTPTHPTLAIGATLTVVSGELGGQWVAEDDDGVVVLVSAAE